MHCVFFDEYLYVYIYSLKPVLEHGPTDQQSHTSTIRTLGAPVPRYICICAYCIYIHMHTAYCIQAYCVVSVHILLDCCPNLRVLKKKIKQACLNLALQCPTDQNMFSYPKINIYIQYNLNNFCCGYIRNDVYKIEYIKIFSLE